MSRWIKKGDKIVVISGNEKGKTGEVIARHADRIVVQGVNIRKKHAKRRQKAPGAEIIEMETPFHVSNAALCDTDGEAVKAKVRFNKDGSKELYYLKGGKEVALRQVSKHS